MGDNRKLMCARKCWEIISLLGGSIIGMMSYNSCERFIYYIFSIYTDYIYKYITDFAPYTCVANEMLFLLFIFLIHFIF